MDKLTRLEAEADRRGTALAAAASRFARRFSPLTLADEALGRLGPADEIIERASRVVRRYPLATMALALSASFLAWQVLRDGPRRVSPQSRLSLPARRRRRRSSRALVPAGFANPNKGTES